MNSIKDLKEADLFKGVDMKQLQLYGKHFTEKNFETGELVFAQGGLAENLYILLEGHPWHKGQGRGRYNSLFCGEEGRNLWAFFFDQTLSK
jgi:hypothetical protein